VTSCPAGPAVPTADKGHGINATESGPESHQAGNPKIASKVLDCLISPQIDGDGNQGLIRLSAQGDALFLGGRRCPNKKKNNQKLKKR